MTEQKSFKRLVRARMAKTGERYAAARAALLASCEPTAAVKLATSDASIRERTGRGWEEWFDALDTWGAADRTHREIARWVAERQGVDALAWNAQAVAGTYALARGLRQPGEHADGFRVSASKTIAAPPEAVFDAFVEPALRGRWLTDAPPLRERTATRPRRARFDWGDGPQRIHVTVDPKGDGRVTVTVAHIRLTDAAEAERVKPLWRARLAALEACVARM